MLCEAQGESLRITSSVRVNLDRDGERGFDYLTFTLVSSKAHREGVGLRVADSHTGNHPEGGFIPLETIRRLLVIIGRRSYLGFEWEAFEIGDEGRKAHLLEDKFLALGWHLEEIHVTWAHLEKKRTRLRLYTKNHEELCIQSGETV
ncbi:hypothetical protein Tco_0823845 [Tanacetum coccineum]|uniref:Uncharacterized protein n=1 Tax=Tanacetum coccineum TaxID=301880 RepID=A0ABQ5AJ10_9ASTR